MPERENGSRFLEISQGRYKLTQKEEVQMLPATKPIVGPPASVSVSRGLTLKTGDYESARVDETITMPCNADPQEIESVRKAISQEVESHIEAYYTLIKGTPIERAKAVKAGALKLEDFDPKSRAAVEALLPHA